MQKGIGCTKGGLYPPNKVQGSSYLCCSLGGYNGIAEKSIRRPSVGEGEPGWEAHDNLDLCDCEEAVGAELVEAKAMDNRKGIGVLRGSVRVQDSG